MQLKVRQFSWHMANANKVWPGTFALAMYIEENRGKYSSGPILELGAATGALAIFLSAPPRSFDVTTSDIDDGGDVEANIAHNFALNSKLSSHCDPYKDNIGKA
jgi:predicted nicotinamide N-methyase